MIILDIEAPKDCYTCQFVDREWDTCHVDDSIIAVVDQKGVKHEKCPLKTEEECLAVATKMVMDFICKCEGSQSNLITPDGEELFTDWIYVVRGLEQIMEWAKRKESQCGYKRQDVQTEENMQMDDLREEQEERLGVAPILNPKTT